MARRTRYWPRNLQLHIALQPAPVRSGKDRRHPPPTSCPSISSSRELRPKPRYGNLENEFRLACIRVPSACCCQLHRMGRLPKPDPDAHPFSRCHLRQPLDIDLASVGTCVVRYHSTSSISHRRPFGPDSITPFVHKKTIYSQHLRAFHRLSKQFLGQTQIEEVPLCIRGMTGKAATGKIRNFETNPSPKSAIPLVCLYATDT